MSCDCKSNMKYKSYFIKIFHPEGQTPKFKSRTGVISEEFIVFYQFDDKKRAHILCPYMNENEKKYRIVQVSYEDIQEMMKNKISGVKKLGTRRNGMKIRPDDPEWQSRRPEPLRLEEFV